MKKRNIQHNYVNGGHKGLDKERKKNNIKKSFSHTLTSIL
jgi:hypothetical protein